MKRTTIGAMVMLASLFFAGGSARAQEVDPTPQRECTNTPDGGCWTCTTNADGKRECYNGGQDCTLETASNGTKYWFCEGPIGKGPGSGGYRPPRPIGHRAR
jgi:hypothetical protein